MVIDKIYTTITETIIWIVLLTSYPYIFSLILPIPSFAVMQAFTLSSLIILGMLLKHTLNNLPKNITNIFIIQSIVWFSFCAIHHDSSYIVRIVYLFVTYFSFVSLHNTTSGIKQFFKKYNSWIALMSLGGTLTFFIVLLTGLSPILEFTEQDNRTGYFFGLTSTNTMIGNIIRYSGFFDEPGQMAFWGMWALIFNLLFIHNNKIEKILIFCLTFTFSIAYYIQLFIYLIFFKIKNIRQTIVICILALIIGLSIYAVQKDYPALYKFTFERFETNKSGDIKGDNRSNLATIAKDVFLKHPIIGVGARKAIENMEYMGDNPYTLLAYDGIIGTVNTYLPLFFIIVWNYKRKLLMKAIFIIAIGYLQRPFSVYFISPFILYGFIILSYYKYNENNNNYSKLQCFKKY